MLFQNKIFNNDKILINLYYLTIITIFNLSDLIFYDYDLYLIFIFIFMIDFRFIKKTLYKRCFFRFDQMLLFQK